MLNQAFSSSMFKDPSLKEAAKALDKKDFKQLAALAAAGLKINEIDDAGAGPTLLVYALGKRNKPAMRELLNLGADANLYLSGDVSAMMLAAGGDDQELLTLLLDKGGNPNLRNDRHEPVTFTAAAQKRWKNLNLLLDRGADINGTDRGGYTVVLYLAEIDEYEPVMKLLERGADFRKANAVGWTLAHFIAESRLLPDSDEGQWKEKCKAFLLSKGVVFPPPPPVMNQAMQDDRQTGSHSKEPPALIDVYETTDGFAGSLSRVTISNDGHWVSKALKGKGAEGKLSPEALRALQQKLSAWEPQAKSLANGWAEPAFGGCTNPLEMKAVRMAGVALHYSRPSGLKERVEEPADRMTLRKDFIHEIRERVSDLMRGASDSKKPPTNSHDMAVQKKPSAAPLPSRLVPESERAPVPEIPADWPDRELYRKIGEAYSARGMKTEDIFTTLQQIRQGLADVPAPQQRRTLDGILKELSVGGART